MISREPVRLADPEAAVDAVIERLGGRIRVALPLGLGKPARFVDALYRRVRSSPELSLEIHTALTLEAPRARSDLEARFLGPLQARLFDGVPGFEYAADLRAGRLPANVRVNEFYFRPGAWLGSPGAQQAYVSSNYSLAARDVARRGVDLIAQMVAPAPGDGAGGRFSASSNPDLTGDLIDAVVAAGAPPPLLLGEVNPALPYLYGDAEMDAGRFDLLLAGDAFDYPLFPVPNRPVSLAEQAIGLRVAALVRDGGTLQIGIGSMGDAVADALALRRRDNPRFRALLDALGVAGGERDDLPAGLYGMSEMFIEGFLHLRRHGVLRRTVGDGVFLHGGFFLGSAGFYRQLHELGEADRQGIRMSRISFTNSLLGHPGKLADRRDARFVNTAMMMSLLGAATSDALEDGRVVSGVGGQHDFVSMAQALPGGRSLLVLPATRTSSGRVTSNIVWRYGHTTIPRHLRDVVVTEYGVADLRGRSDQDVIVAMLGIADARFQEDLRRRAVKAGKLDRRYRIPARYRRNTPEHLRDGLDRAGLLGALPWYPVGADFTREEAELAVALAALGEQRGSFRALAGLARRGWRERHDPRWRPALERMGLDRPAGLRDRLSAALVAGALAVELGGPAAARPLGPAFL